MDFMTEHWELVTAAVGAVAVLGVAVARYMAKKTDTPDDDARVDAVEDFLEEIGFIEEEDGK